MRQRVGGLLLVVLILSDGRRKTSKAVSGNKIPATLGELSDNMNEAETSDAVQGRSNQTRGYSLTSGISDGLKSVKTDPGGILVDFLKAMVGFEFNDEEATIREKMRQVATHSGVKLTGVLLTALNPLLGVVFSIFSAVFGFTDGPESPSEFLIKADVDTMIQGSLREFRHNELEEKLIEIMDYMDGASAYPQNWESVPVLMWGSFSAVFKDCWKEPGSDACKQWRIGSGCDSCKAGASLQMELTFTALMISCGWSVAAYGYPFAFFAELITKAAERSRQHYLEFKKARLNAGITRGEVYCEDYNGHTRRPQYCQRKAHRDHLLDTDFCTPPLQEYYDRNKEGTLVRCDSTGCSKAKTYLQDLSDSCWDDYHEDMYLDLQKSAKLSKALPECAKDLQQYKHGRERHEQGRIN